MVVISSEKWNQLTAIPNDGDSQSGSSFQLSSADENSNEREEAVALNLKFYDRVQRTATNYYISLISDLRGCREEFHSNIQQVKSHIRSNFRDLMKTCLDEEEVALQNLQEYYEHQVEVINNKEKFARQNLNDIAHQTAFGQDIISKPVMPFELPNLLSFQSTFEDCDFRKHWKLVPHAYEVKTEMEDGHRNFKDICWDNNKFSIHDILADRDLYNYFVTKKNMRKNSPLPSENVENDESEFSESISNISLEDNKIPEDMDQATMTEYDVVCNNLMDMHPFKETCSETDTTLSLSSADDHISPDLKKWLKSEQPPPSGMTFSDYFKSLDQFEWLANDMESLTCKDEMVEDYFVVPESENSSAEGENFTELVHGWFHEEIPEIDADVWLQKS